MQDNNSTELLREKEKKKAKMLEKLKTAGRDSNMEHVIIRGHELEPIDMV